MRCPICNHEARREGNPYRPFCSERCKLIDLDNWLSGRYRIPSPAERQGFIVEEEADAEKTES